MPAQLPYLGLTACTSALSAPRALISRRFSSMTVPMLPLGGWAHDRDRRGIQEVVERAPHANSRIALPFIL
jgi:hypothetical protein